jgi:uncharacterized protein
MKIVVSGSSGLVGAALVAALRRENHSVLCLVRPGRQASGGDVAWNPESGEIDTAKIEASDAIVHLAGASIADGRWSEDRKRVLRTSRVDSTQNLIESLKALSQPPKVFVCSSAIGYYGDRGDELLTEASAAGRGFLADLARDWEAAALGAERVGIRTVVLRLGMILASHGGALAKMLPPFKLGVGGKLGSGKQWMSWILLDDVIGVIRAAIQSVGWRGPINVVSPNPVTNEEFTRTLARILHRPAIFPVPKTMLRFVFGEMADALLLGSQRVIPEKLVAAGYPFSHANLETALRSILTAQKQ